MSYSQLVQPFRLEPRGPFSLAEANRYFGGWPTLSSDPSAAVVVTQDPQDILTGEVHHAAGEDAEATWRTVLARSIRARLSENHGDTLHAGDIDSRRKSALVGAD